MLQFILWYLVIGLLGWISLPIAYRLFAWLPDRGYVFSRSLGWLFTGYLFWMLVSMRVAQNDAGGVLLSILVLGAVSLWLFTRSGTPTQMRDWLRSERKWVLVSELVFFVAFAAWAFVRSANPDITYTEKPMEMAFINGILNSPSFPPLDPWLSGFSISYYYFGYVLVAMLIHLTGVSTGVAFNLAISLVFGLTALGAYGILYNLLRHRKPAEGSVSRGLSAYLTPIFAPFLVLVAGNLEGILEFLHARGLFWSQAADGTWVSPFWTWLGVLDLTDPPIQPFSWALKRGGWLFWRGSRVLADTNFNGTFMEVIDEFPFFSYLLADLHPHVLAMPFTLLVIALALNIFLAPRQAGFNLFGFHIPMDRPMFFVSALVLGGLGFLNTWDFPIYIAVFCGVLVMRQAFFEGWRWQRLLDFFAPALALGVLGILLYFPFYLSFSSQAGGILPSLVYYTRGAQLWVMFGLLLIPLFTFLAVQFVRYYGWRDLGWGIAVAAGLGLILWTGAYPLLFLIVGGLVFFSVWSKQAHPLLKGLLGSAGLIGLLWSLSYLYGWAAGSLDGGLESVGQLFLSNLGLNLDAYPDRSLAIGALLTEATNRRLTAPGAWVTLLLFFGLLFPLIPAWTHQQNENTAVPGQTAMPGQPLPAKNPSPPDHLFILVLLLVGGLLVLGPEYFYLRDHFGNRMNTIFKFYFQAWVLWSIAGAYGIGFLLRSLGKVSGLVFRIGLVALVGLCLAYPVAMLDHKTNGFKPVTGRFTLDGMTFIPEAQREAINWLKQAELGVLVEAIGEGGGSYSPEAGRVSAFSGQPTVLGWYGHEDQWRGSNEGLLERQSAVETLYTTRSWVDAQAIIDRYQIRYILVSNYERARYPVDETKFQAYLKTAFQSGDVTIYETPQYHIAMQGVP